MTGTIHIDLLRHGETAGGARFRGSTEDLLTGFGWTQMWTAVEKHGPCWDRIISSPLMRCALFARALGDRLSIPLAFDERIREMHFGAWEGRRAAELMATDADALARFWKDPAHHTPPEAEPLLSFKVRVLTAWDEIIGKPRGDKVLLITHGGVIRVILCHVLQQPVDRLLELEVGYATLQRVCIRHTRGHRRTALVAAAPF